MQDDWFNVSWGTTTTTSDRPLKRLSAAGPVLAHWTRIKGAIYPQDRQLTYVLGVQRSSMKILSRLKHPETICWQQQNAVTINHYSFFGMNWTLSCTPGSIIIFEFVFFASCWPILTHIFLTSPCCSVPTVKPTIFWCLFHVRRDLAEHRPALLHLWELHRQMEVMGGTSTGRERIS